MYYHRSEVHSIATALSVSKRILAEKKKINMKISHTLMSSSSQNLHSIIRLREKIQHFTETSHLIT